MLLRNSAFHESHKYLHALYHTVNTKERTSGSPIHRAVFFRRLPSGSNNLYSPGILFLFQQTTPKKPVTIPASCKNLSAGAPPCHLVLHLPGNYEYICGKSLAFLAYTSRHNRISPGRITPSSFRSTQSLSVLPKSNSDEFSPDPHHRTTKICASQALLLSIRCRSSSSTRGI